MTPTEEMLAQAATLRKRMGLRADAAISITAHPETARHLDREVLEANAIHLHVEPGLRSH